MPTPDWAALTDELSNIATESLTDLKAGVEADLKEFGAVIAGDMVLAIKNGDKELQEELKNQVRALGEVHRIRLVQEQWEILDRVLSVALRVAGTLVTLT